VERDLEMCGIYGRIGARDDELDRRATLSLNHRVPMTADC
jgi:hypothetical protein